MKVFTSNLLHGILVLMIFSGCEKLLSEKSDKRLVVPNKLSDLQALMDNNVITSAGPVSGEMSADDYYVSTETFNALNDDFSRSLYTWKGAFIYDRPNNDWSYTYRAIYYSTTILERLGEIRRTSENAREWDHVQAQALTLRAFRYLSAIVVWGKAYDAATAATDLGIPLRQTADFNAQSVRVSVQETYEEIIRSLKTAIPSLPDHGQGITRADKALAYACLARAYLFMRDYNQAGLYADSAYAVNPILLDYNALENETFPQVNLGETSPEILFYLDGGPGQLFDFEIHRVNPDLYASFENNDLRKNLFFHDQGDGSYSFKGNYTGSQYSNFVGISNAEVYLIRAECRARAGKVGEAMDILNELLIKRYDNTQPFSPLTAINTTEALETILLERRKELMFRGLRWPDIKRLNKEGANIVLTRVIDGQTYTLPPNDNRYALPIPEDIIELSGMPQNPQ